MFCSYNYRSWYLNTFMHTHIPCTLDSDSIHNMFNNVSYPYIIFASTVYGNLGYQIIQ